jgi:hypothetical protein
MFIIDVWCTDCPVAEEKILGKNSAPAGGRAGQRIVKIENRLQISLSCTSSSEG